MLKSLLSIVPAIALALVLTTGCESPAQPEDLSPVPEASLDPNSNFGPGGAGDLRGFGRGGEFDRGGAGAGGQFGSQQAIDQKTNADADGWVPADPANNLGMPVIYFAYDSDVLVPSETANLDKIAAYLQKNPSLGLVIEGHCDSRGTDEYNRALGERRANAIRAYLVTKGVADGKIKTVSYGEDKPAGDGHDESAWSRNRRGEFAIFQK